MHMFYKYKGDAVCVWVAQYIKVIDNGMLE